jgi:hypothetical protein
MNRFIQVCLFVLTFVFSLHANECLNKLTIQSDLIKSRLKERRQLLRQRVIPPLYP